MRVVILGGKNVEGVVGKDVIFTQQDIRKIPEIAKYRAVVTTPPMLSHFVKVCLELGLTVAIIGEDLKHLSEGVRIKITEEGMFINGD